MERSGSPSIFAFEDQKVANVAPHVRAETRRQEEMRDPTPLAISTLPGRRRARSPLPTGHYMHIHNDVIPL